MGILGIAGIVTWDDRNVIYGERKIAVVKLTILEWICELIHFDSINRNGVFCDSCKKDWTVGKFPGHCE